MNTVLLIGKGYWGKNWYNTLLKKNIRFAVVEPKIECGVDQNGIPIFKTLDEVDFAHYTHAIVATHAEGHIKIFETLVAKGMPASRILVEKPCGSSWINSEKLEGCFPGYIQLHSEAFRYIRHHIKRIGTPHLYKSIRASMGPRIRNDCSVIADYMIHDLYLFLSLFQPYNRIEIVSRLTTSRLSMHGNDTAFLNLYNPDVHVLADMFSSWWYPMKERRVIIQGDKGTFIWVNDDLYFNESRYEESKGTDKFGNFGYELIQAEDERIPLASATAMENELDALLTGHYAGSCLLVQPVWNLIKEISWHTRYRY